jgi:hypothetical protein
MEAEMIEGNFENDTLSILSFIVSDLSKVEVFENIEASARFSSGLS